MATKTSMIKCEEFVDQPLKDKRGHDKKVGVIPGIGKTAKKELEKNNITLAKQVLGSPCQIMLAFFLE